MSIQELTAIVPPPSNAIGAPDTAAWEGAQKQLRTTLPDDYHDFLLTYGNGNIGRFFRVFNVCSSDSAIGMPEIQRMCDALKLFKEEEADDFPFSVYPAKSGLLPWGSDENGFVYCWLTKGPSDQWTVVRTERAGPPFGSFSFPMTTFLAKVLRKEIQFWRHPEDRTQEDLMFVSFEETGLAPRKKKGKRK